ncbi:MAG: hypothetical protein WEF86_12090 [Gemmatimonadota bacterium]
MSRRSSAGRQHRSGLLAQELESLLGSMDTMLEAYRLRVGGRLAELLHDLHGDPSMGKPAQPFTIRTADQMLAFIGALELKPHKGRPKDFSKLQRLAEELDQLVPPER